MIGTANVVVKPPPARLERVAAGGWASNELRSEHRFHCIAISCHGHLSMLEGAFRGGSITPETLKRHTARLGQIEGQLRFYYRVHGPRILIEYDVVDPPTSQGGHVHAITRDPTNDYGMDWLGLHYEEGNPIPGGPPPGGGAPKP
jgi:hypothetical protein